MPIYADEFLSHVDRVTQQTRWYEFIGGDVAEKAASLRVFIDEARIAATERAVSRSRSRSPR